MEGGEEPAPARCGAKPCDAAVGPHADVRVYAKDEGFTDLIRGAATLGAVPNLVLHRVGNPNLGDVHPWHAAILPAAETDVAELVGGESAEAWVRFGPA